MKPRAAAAALLALSLVASISLVHAQTTVPATQSAPRKFATITLANPRALAIDPAGNLYVGDVEGGKISKITPAGQVSTLGGAGAAEITDPLGIALGRDGAIYIADADGNMIFKIPPGGAAAPLVKGETALLLKTPTGVAVDSKGNAFISNNADNTILKITPDGAVSIFAGKSGTGGAADGKADAATFEKPRSIAIDAKDNLYIADEGNSNIRMITPEGVVSTLAGKAGDSGSADGTGPAAKFAAPRALTAAADGTVYVADTDNNTVRKITPKGEVTTLAGKPGDTGSTDGPGPAARFSEPRAIAVDAAGNVFLGDTGNACIRQITPAGVVTTIAGAAKP